MLNVESHTIIHAASDLVRDCYWDYQNWHLLFSKTIYNTRLVREENGVFYIEVHHKKAGRVMNIMTRDLNGDIHLEEWKQRYKATFINHFDSVGNFTRYTVYGTIHLNGFYNIIEPFLGKVVSHRIRKYILEPVKIYAESQ